jgi:hypothetical protein
MHGDKHTDSAQAKKPLLDPNQPREDVTETGGEYAGKHPTESNPDIVKPGTGGQATGQTTRS